MKDLAYIPESNPQTCSLNAIAKLAYKNYEEKKIQEQIVPLYLKDAVKK